MKTAALIEKSPQETNAHLWFSRGGAAFSLPMAEVLELRSFAKLRPLPLADPSLAGFVSFRNLILPVFDPLVLAGLPSAPIAHPPLAAVGILHQRPCLALLVDRVGRILNLDRNRQIPLEPDSLSEPLAFSDCRHESGVGDILVLDIEGLARQMSLA